MKKILITLLVLALSLSTLFAGDSFYEAEPAAYGSIGKSYRPNNAEVLGMGGAGIALMTSENALFYNPASLAEGRFRLSLPSVGVTLYHPYDLVKKDSNGESFLNKAMKASKDNMGSLVTDLLSIVGTSFSPLMKVDVSTGMILPFGLGFGVYVTDTAYTYSASVIDEVNAVAALGYAYKLNLGSIALSLGVDAKFSALAFTKRIGSTEVISIMNSSDVMSTKLTLASGWAPLMDVGATLSIGKSLFASVVYSDINLTGYKMKVTETTIGDLSKNYQDLVKTGEDFTIKGEGYLNAGLGFKYDMKLLKFKLACDFNDILGFVKSDEIDARSFVYHLSAGAEVGLFNTIILRGGFNSGYFTAGASFDLFVFRIDAAYFWQEMGTTAGRRGLDGLTIRFNIGYER